MKIMIFFIPRIKFSERFKAIEAMCLHYSILATLANLSR